MLCYLGLVTRPHYILIESHNCWTFQSCWVGGWVGGVPATTEIVLTKTSPRPQSKVWSRPDYTSRAVGSLGRQIRMLIYLVAPWLRGCCKIEAEHNGEWLQPGK